MLSSQYLIRCPWARGTMQSKMDAHVRLDSLRVALAVDGRRQDELHVSVHGLHSHQAKAKDCGPREAHLADGLVVRGRGWAKARGV